MSEGRRPDRVLETSEEQWRAAFDSVFLAGCGSADAVVRHGTAPDLASPGCCQPR